VLCFCLLALAAPTVQAQDMSMPPCTDEQNDSYNNYFLAGFSEAQQADRVALDFALGDIGVAELPPEAQLLELLDASRNEMLDYLEGNAEMYAHLEGETPCLEIILLTASRASLLINVWLGQIANIEDSFSTAVFPYLHGYTSVQSSVYPEPAKFCDSAPALEYLQSMYFDIVAAADWAYRLGTNEVNLSDLQQDELQARYGVAADDFEVYVLYPDTDRICTEASALLGARAALLNQAAILQLFDFADDDANMILLPAKLTYMLEVLTVANLLESALSTGSISETVSVSSSSTSQAASAPSTGSPASDALWSASGRGDKKASLDLDFAPGIYRFNLNQPNIDGDWGSIWLDDIVSIPDDCFTSLLSFPTQMRIRQDCRIFATLDVGFYSAYADTEWAVSITKLD